MSNNISKMAVAGFAIFSMIFGSGNIVFPLILGKDFASNYGWSMIGWVLTTVLLPLVGYFAVFLYDGDHKKFLAPIGKTGTFVLMSLLMLMVGPFGVMARCVNVAFGGIHVVVPGLSEWAFNLFYTIFIVSLAWNPGKIVQIIGIIFTPLKFGGVAAVVLGALWLGNAFSDIPASNTPPLTAFYQSAKVGFQTMDVIAAVLLGSTVFGYVKKSLPETASQKDFIKFSAGACFIGAVALAVIYCGLLLIGAQYSAELGGTPNESLFAKIALLAMKDSASWFVAIVIAVSCLATNIALCSAFTDFVHSEVLKGKGNRKLLLALTGGLAFCASLLGFDDICAILGQILEVIYPALIVFVLARLVYFFVKKPQ